MKSFHRHLFLLNRNHSFPDGFTLTESLVAVIILSLTFSIMLPAFLNFGIENAKGRMRSGAIAVSNSILSDLRKTKFDDLDDQLGETTTDIEQMGYSYRVTQYICTDLSGSPLDADDPAATCEETVAQNDFSRQILLIVEINNEPIYRVQTIFSQLKS